MIKKSLIFFLLTCLSIYNAKSADAFYPEATFFSQDNESYFLHTIERGQTIFSIANMYGVTQDAILKLNPGSETGIKAGEVLKIPQKSGSYIYHTIQPKETLYSLARQYYMKGEDIIAVNPGLSVETFTIGKTIRIPTNMVTSPIEGGNEIENQFKTNSLLNQSGPASRVPTIKVALMLPYGTKKGLAVNNDLQKRMTEYTEGFLLALQDLKKKGISVDLKLIDIGNGEKTDELKKIVADPELQKLNLIIGGLSDQQIKLLSQFSKDYNIPYIIPITSTSDAVSDNNHIFQINTPQPYLYSKASLAVANKHRKDRVIIIKNINQTSNRDVFIKTLEEDLKQKGVDYHVLTYNNKNFSTNLKELLDQGKKNVIIPSDDSAETLSLVINPLKVFIETNSSLNISLFGYPKWQVFGAGFSEDFFKLNASFYTFYYADPTSIETKDFFNTFYKWYSKPLMTNIPKYGILGYDTGCYFLEMIHTYGVNFESNINKLASFKGVQTDFHFERVNNWGGFINTNLYIVEFNPDYTISKTRIN